MTKYVCAHCGRRVEILEEESLNNGTTLTCNECGRVTIVELFTPDERPWCTLQSKCR